MDVIQASVFLVGSILISLGGLVLLATAVLINNIFSRYWKPVRLYTYHQTPAVQHEPRFEETRKK